MIKLDNYDNWNLAFYHLGAKGSPVSTIFDFSKEEFFVRGTILALNDARTLSAFCHWVNLFGNKLDPEKIEAALKMLEFDRAWLGYYLDLINHPKFSHLYKFAKAKDDLVIIHKVRKPDPILLKWNIYSRPLTETAEKYLHLNNQKNRVF